MCHRVLAAYILEVITWNRNIFSLSSWWCKHSELLFTCLATPSTPYYISFVVLKWFGYSLSCQPYEYIIGWSSNCLQYSKQVSPETLCRRKSLGMEEKRNLFSFLLRVYFFLKINMQNVTNSNLYIGLCGHNHHKQYRTILWPLSKDYLLLSLQIYPLSPQS